MTIAGQRPIGVRVSDADDGPIMGPESAVEGLPPIVERYGLSFAS